MSFDKLMDRVRKEKRELALIYKVSETSIVWMGGHRYAVLLQNGKEVSVTV